jgi:hypothetical protein
MALSRGSGERFGGIGFRSFTDDTLLYHRKDFLKNEVSPHELADPYPVIPTFFRFA